MMIYEATCLKCLETFNPQPSLNSYTPETTTAPPDTVWHGEHGFTPDDLEHGLRKNGMETCGGVGKLEGAWTSG